MGLTTIFKKIKAYYNKDAYVISITYKGQPISATGSTEASVFKSIIYLMSFVDIAEVKKQSKNKKGLVEVI